MNIYEMVTSKIIKDLEAGVASWVKPWKAGASGELPRNAVSQRNYTGVNVLLLWGELVEKGYQLPTWLTYKQAQGLGGNVRKGEHGTHIVYASTFHKTQTDEQGEVTERDIPFLKGYVVFNVCQTEGLPEHLCAIPEKPVNRIETVEAFINSIGATVYDMGDKACYVPSMDIIRLPPPHQFDGVEHYYATSLHEHGHWTGHPSRLNRDLTGRFKTEAYAAEELVAELTAAFLCAHLGIEGRLQHSEYIGSWLKILHNDYRAIFTAAAKANQATQYLMAL